jgi:hypothetical protein
MEFLGQFLKGFMQGTFLLSFNNIGIGGVVVLRV